MKTLILTIVLVVAFNSAAGGQTPEIKASGPITQAEELKTLDLSWYQAVANRDLDALGRLLADDYRLSLDASRTLTKAQEIEAVKNSDPLYDFGSVKLKDVIARVEGERATVSGFLTVRPGNGDKDFQRRYFYTRTFVRRDGRWQVLTCRLVTLSIDAR